MLTQSCDLFCLLKRFAFLRRRSGECAAPHRSDTVTASTSSAGTVGVGSAEHVQKLQMTSLLSTFVICAPGQNRLVVNKSCGVFLIFVFEMSRNVFVCRLYFSNRLTA